MRRLVAGRVPGHRWPGAAGRGGRAGVLRHAAGPGARLAAGRRPAGRSRGAGLGAAYLGRRAGCLSRLARCPGAGGAAAGRWKKPLWQQGPQAVQAN